MPARGKDAACGNLQRGNRVVAAYVTVYANKRLMAFADMCVDMDPNGWCITMHHCTAILASFAQNSLKDI